MQHIHAMLVAIQAVLVRVCTVRVHHKCITCKQTSFMRELLLKINSQEQPALSGPLCPGQGNRRAGMNYNFSPGSSLYNVIIVTIARTPLWKQLL